MRQTVNSNRGYGKISVYLYSDLLAFSSSVRVGSAFAVASVSNNSEMPAFSSAVFVVLSEPFSTRSHAKQLRRFGPEYVRFLPYLRVFLLVAVLRNKMTAFAFMWLVRRLFCPDEFHSRANRGGKRWVFL